MADKPETPKAPVPPPARVMQVKTPFDKIKLCAEICAFLGAAGFFVYHFCIGWFEQSLSTSVETSRVHDPMYDGQDILAITVRFKNAVGLVRISDAIAHVQFDDGAITNRLQGIVRYDYVDGKLIPGKVSPRKPRTGLGPDQEIMLSTFVKVPEHSTCVIDTAILVWQWRRSALCEVRSAAISLPLADAAHHRGLAEPSARTN